MSTAMTTTDWSAFYARVRAFVASRVRHSSDVDDLVHLIFERAIAKSTGVEIESTTGWLFGIARNAVADHFRAQAQTLIAEAATLEAEPPLGESEQERQAVFACMEPLLAALPASSAQLLRWADMEGRSMRAIASELDISLTAAKSRVQRARKDFVQTTRDCCAITLDARGRVTDLTPKNNPAAVACAVSAACCSDDD
jgi:RNA polymerase sigma-70 factor (ECF subfamily)